ncbi:MAG: DNA polymerase III subunit gamma/tau [Acidobacteriaceae bacterium]|nr:DNA polymerase III subunit gamma/tau [Acidobacteriaceae bacterium]
MEYQVLARKYRPQRFADVAGQDHVTRTLMNALEQNRVAHGYIFSGHRGIGKTTIARILAQALNCRTAVGSAERPTAEPCGVCESCTEVRSGSAVDVIEIDAATNRGIDEIRELRDAARYAPARDRYKIYILDEAHQITDAAFNALLKTLEEPPSHVVFMMATTEPENIPQTIRSRCQHFSFHAVKFDDILAQLKMIAEHEQVTAEDAALALLAEAGDGSMRDALSIMDQAIASAPVEDGRPVLAAAQIRELMGSVPNAVFERLLEAVAQGQSAELMEQINVLLNAGHSPSSLARQMVRYLRNALMAKIGGEQTELLQISSDERARANRTAMLFSEEEITRNLQIILRTFDDLNYRQEQRFHLELGLLKLVHAQRLLPLEEFLSAVAAGAPARSAAPPARPSAAPSTPRATASAPKPAAPSVSPFGSSSSGGWSRSSAPVQTAATAPDLISETAPSISAHSAPQPAVAHKVMPFPVAPAPSVPAIEPAEPDVAEAPQPAPATGSNTDMTAIQRACCLTLAGAGHDSASQLLSGALWTLDGSNLKIEVGGIGKKMLALTVNAAAEKVIKQRLQELGGPARFMVVPGEGGTAQTGSGTMAVPEGSVQQAAMENPLVQKAKEIFQAEVRSVLDLRAK